MSDNNQNGWNEYSRLVLKELETLADGIESVKKELQEVRQDMAKMQVKEDRMEEIKQWKERVDDVASPIQLKELINEVSSLKEFKTRAITIFAVVQFIMAFSVWYVKFFPTG